MCMLANILLLYLQPVKADHLDDLGGLGLIGVQAASGLGPSPPNDAKFCWISWVYTGGAFTVTWQFFPGTDGGLVFHMPQASGALTSVFLMLNQNTSLYSVADGISISSDHTIDMTALRKESGSAIWDLGSGVGVDPHVPLVPDITALLPGQNGWQLLPDGTYYLTYNANAECGGCKIIIHFYGKRMPMIARGDINLDKRFNIGDIVLAERYLSGLTTLTPEQIFQGDFVPQGAKDNEISLPDLLYLMQQL